jgi:hypothetical protein
VKNFLAENVDLMMEISEKIRVASGIDDVDIDLAEGDAEAAEVDEEEDVDA